MIKFCNKHDYQILYLLTESPAEKAGIQVGQILISVNGVNVLELPHSEIIKLVQQCKLKPFLLFLHVCIEEIESTS